MVIGHFWSFVHVMFISTFAVLVCRKQLIINIIVCFLKTFLSDLDGVPVYNAFLRLLVWLLSACEHTHEYIIVILIGLVVIHRYILSHMCTCVLLWLVSTAQYGPHLLMLESFKHNTLMSPSAQPICLVKLKASLSFWHLLSYISIWLINSRKTAQT